MIWLKNLRNVFLLLTLLIMAVRCPSKNDHQPASQVIPIKGDPMVFLKNTVQDSESGIPDTLLTLDTEWELQPSGYISSQQIKIDSNDEAEERYKPTESIDGQNFQDLLTYYKLTTKNGLDNEFSFSTSRPNNFLLNLKKSNDKIKLSSISFQYDGQDVEINNFKVHHYSVKNDNSSFSILTSFKIEKYVYLYSFNFIKKEDATLLERTLSKVYRYLNGPGVASRWNQSKTLNVQICKHSLPIYNQMMKESVNRWKQLLNERLNLEVTESDSCPPFSDLNSLTIMHVSEWIEVFGTTGHLAQAMTIHNYYSSEIADSDIFFLESEWNEGYERHNVTLSDSRLYESLSFQMDYKGTMTHEFGHSLGLDHQFDGTKSVMSYDGTNNIQPYDIDAIQALYPLIQKEDDSAKEE